MLIDLGSTSAMEDGSELHLEEMRGRKKWPVPPFVVGCCLTDPVRKREDLRNRVAR